MEPEPSGVSRRTLLSAGAGVPITAVLLSACGESGGGPAGGAGGYGQPAPRPSSAEPTPTDDGPTEATSEEPAAPEGAALAAVDDIPVGGALVVQDGPGGKPVVLARPRRDTVVAFSAVCTHRGCTVAAEGAGLRCPCHGSTYDLTGANTGGPAPSPLPKVDVTVTDGQVRQA